MFLREKIKTWFEEAVRLDVQAPQALKETLLRGHPKIDGFIDNLCAEIEKAERICIKRGVTLKMKTIQDTVYDMTKYFMLGMEGEAKRRYESDLERLAREAKINETKEFDKVLAGEAEGEFLEAGVISNEKIDEEREAAINAH